MRPYARFFPGIPICLSLLLGACDGRAVGSRDGVPLPNSLQDTSVHAGHPDLPEYGPPPSIDSVWSKQARGQVLYVPLYSHIFHGTEHREFDLTATLSIRNTSPTTAISIRVVDYFDSRGALLKSYLDGTRVLGPLASTYLVIEERDRSGGVGANFMVEWRSDLLTTPPVIEAVMIGTGGGQGISFTSPARILREW
jgi:hypothetical protein